MHLLHTCLVLMVIDRISKMDAVEGARSFPDDCMPPERDYDSREALFEAINAWAAPRGYAFRTGRSHKEKSGKVTVTYTCDRACHPPSDSKIRKRLTSTRGTGCQFSLLAKQSLDRARWSVKYRSESRFAAHNHEPSLHKSAHPNLRKLSEAERSTITKLTRAGVPPKNIIIYVRQNFSTDATQQDIYNRIAESKRELSALSNEMQLES